MRHIYRVLKSLTVRGEVLANPGDILYTASVHDYGLCRDDELILGKKHVFVCKSEDGAEDCFTYPLEDLQVIGNVEIILLSDKEVKEECGAGTERCCAYLLIAPTGLQCGRNQSVAVHIRERVRKQNMRARRLPVKPYPECKLEDLK